MPASKILIIGLDCAAPEIVFDRFADDLPVLSRLRQQSRWGRLESVKPPITVPAWAAMMSGKDPGRLGIYGFRNRASTRYDDLVTVNSDTVKEPQLWDILGSLGLSSIVIGAPPGYPVRPIRGVRVGCFLTPNTDGSDWVYPTSLAPVIKQKFGQYFVDVPNFRSDDKDRLLREITDLNRQQFDLSEFLLGRERWDFFFLVNIAVDRMHHAFWSTFDPEHRNYEPNSRFEPAMREFYRETDRRIGRLLEFAGPETIVLVVSDHGGKRIDGGICVNEWLIQKGWLALRGPLPDQPLPYAQVGVDWSRTKAWGEGGYYARIFINKLGREPQGTVTPEEFDQFKRELIDGLKSIPDDQGRPLSTSIYSPDEVYPESRGNPPDLFVHFGDLHWRSIGSVGYHAIHTLENDTGPDDANHSQHGLYILRAPGVEPGQADGKLLQIAPTLLKLLGKRIPKDMLHSPMV